MRNDTLNNTKKLIFDYFLSQKINILKFYLFGSRARNDYSETSDYDFLLVIDKEINGTAKRELISNLYRFLAKNQALINMDLIIKSSTKFEIESKEFGALAYNVNNEGVLQS